MLLFLPIFILQDKYMATFDTAQSITEWGIRTYWVIFLHWGEFIDKKYGDDELNVIFFPVPLNDFTKVWIKQLR